MTEYQAKLLATAIQTLIRSEIHTETDADPEVSVDDAFSELVDELQKLSRDMSIKL